MGGRAREAVCSRSRPNVSLDLDSSRSLSLLLLASPTLSPSYSCTLFVHFWVLAKVESPSFRFKR